jgi:hypothetical protein
MTGYLSFSPRNAPWPPCLARAHVHVPPHRVHLFGAPPAPPTRPSNRWRRQRRAAPAAREMQSPARQTRRAATRRTTRQRASRAPDLARAHAPDLARALALESGALNASRSVRVHVRVRARAPGPVTRLAGTRALDAKSSRRRARGMRGETVPSKAAIRARRARRWPTRKRRVAVWTAAMTRGTERHRDADRPSVGTQRRAVGKSMCARTRQRRRRRRRRYRGPTHLLGDSRNARPAKETSRGTATEATTARTGMHTGTGAEATATETATQPASRRENANAQTMRAAAAAREVSPRRTRAPLLRAEGVRRCRGR